MELLNAAQALQTQMSETYRELHRYPELSHQEVETSQRVARWLREIGLEVQAGRQASADTASLGCCAGRWADGRSPSELTWMHSRCRNRAIVTSHRSIPDACTPAGTTRT